MWSRDRWRRDVRLIFRWWRAGGRCTKNHAADVDGEDNRICHQVRDGKVFTRPPASARHDVVIVGGGVSGLTAAYRLQHRDFLLLEKEPHWGGNAYVMEYDGSAYATGRRFLTRTKTRTTSRRKSAWSRCRSTIATPPSFAANGCSIPGAKASTSCPILRRCARASRSSRKTCWRSISRSAARNSTTFRFPIS